MMSATKGGGTPSLRYRPIYGGIFGKSGEYTLATMACIERGLHGVRFMVLHPSTGGVLSVATDKSEALSQARRVLPDWLAQLRRVAKNVAQIIGDLMYTIVDPRIDFEARRH